MTNNKTVFAEIGKKNIALNSQCSINAKGDLLLYGSIGDWVDGLDALSIVQQLEALPGDEITVRINSDGGNVMDGLAMYHALRQSAKKIIIYIDGIAASMAAAIAMAGTERHIPTNAFMHMHKVNVPPVFGGNSLDFEENAARLLSIERAYVSILAEGCAKTESQINSIIEDGKDHFWYGQEAIDFGLATHLIDYEIQIAANLNYSLPTIQKIANDFLNNPRRLNMTSTENQTIKASLFSKDTDIKEDSISISHLKALSTIANQAKVEPSVLEGWINNKTSIEEAGQAALEIVVERNDESLPSGSSGMLYHEVEPNHQNKDEPNRYSHFSEALACRHSGIKPSDHARSVMSYSIAEIAKSVLEDHGIRTRLMSKGSAIVKAMHTTSDFPELLTDAGNRILLNAYEAVPSALKRISKRSTARDFRPLTRIQITGNSNLKKVNEAGEFQHGTMFDASESYKLDTFGQIFSISRQALINDDLGAFSDSAQMMGRLASDFEAQHLVDLLISNPKMKDDTPLLHASRNNLATTLTSTISASIGEGRKSMRLQKSLNGTSPIGVAPIYLLIPASLETEAEKLVSEIYAAKTEDANPFTKKLQVIVEPRLDAVSETGWYLFADPQLAPVIEYAYLEEHEGPYFESRNGFERDAMEIKLRLDFGAGLVDYRGVYHQPGTTEE